MTSPNRPRRALRMPRDAFVAYAQLTEPSQINDRSIPSSLLSPFSNSPPASPFEAPSTSELEQDPGHFPSLADAADMGLLPCCRSTDRRHEFAPRPAAKQGSSGRRFLEMTTQDVTLANAADRVMTRYCRKLGIFL